MRSLVCLRGEKSELSYPRKTGHHLRPCFGAIYGTTHSQSLQTVISLVTHLLSTALWSRSSRFNYLVVQPHATTTITSQLHPSHIQHPPYKTTGTVPLPPRLETSPFPELDRSPCRPRVKASSFVLHCTLFLLPIPP